WSTNHQRYMQDLFAEPLGTFDPLVLFVQQRPMVRQKSDYRIALQAEIADCVQNLAEPLIHVGCLTGIVGAESLDSLRTHYDIAVGRFRPTVFGRIFQVLFEELPRRIPRLVRI